MNVAVVNTGPGVTWPTATESSNCCSLSQCSRTTKSARRKASNTYPLPKSTDPILRNVRNSRQNVNGFAAAPKSGPRRKTDCGFHRPLACKSMKAELGLDFSFLHQTGMAASNADTISVRRLFTLHALMIAASTPTAASHGVLIPLRANFQNACTITATTTAFTPY